MKDLVVLIPGIGGSALAKDGKELWSLTPGAALRGVLSLGASLNTLTMHGDDPDVDDLGDGVVATRVMPDYHIVPGLDWRIDGYGRFAKALREHLGVQPGENYFEFPYDWRRDNRVAARELALLAPQWLKAWRSKSGNDHAKLVLICHSMGGIVARLYLEQFDGFKDTRLLVTFGTPFSGSVKALEFLANGFKKGWGPFTVDLSEMLRSFTSVYQLLPSYRCLQGNDGKWLNLDEVHWDGTNIDGVRLQDALELHRGLRQVVNTRLNADAGHYDVRPVIGNFQRTRWAAARTADGTITSLYSRGADEEGGDGTVAMVSACPPEFLPDYEQAMFASQKHGSLQNDDPVIVHASGVVKATIASDVPVFPAGDTSTSLDVDDVVNTEPLVIRARNDSGLPLTATIRSLNHGDEDRSVSLIVGTDGWAQGQEEDLPEGDYRIIVSGPGAHPVTDVVSVVDVTTLG